MNSQVSRWRWWIHFLLIGCYFVPVTVRGLIYVSHRPVLTSTTGGLLLATVVNLIVFALVFAVACLISRATSEQLLLPWRPGWWVLPLGIGYSVALRLGILLIAMLAVAILLLTGLVTVDSAQAFAAEAAPKVERLVDVNAMQSNPLYFWLTITLASFLVGGLREELWRTGTLAGMRALWPRLFGSRFGEFFAICLIALVFGAGHLSLGLISAAAAAVLGIFLGGIMIWHRSVWPAVFAHGLFDATSFALLPLVAHRLRQLG